MTDRQVLMAKAMAGVYWTNVEQTMEQAFGMKGNKMPVWVSYMREAAAVEQALRGIER